MGAGCHYTIDADRDVKAVWIEIPQNDNDIDGDNYFAWEELKEDIENILRYEIPSMVDGCGGQNYLDYGYLYKIHFESTYYGDSMVINFKLRSYDYDYVEIAENNAVKSYCKVVTALNKYFDLYQATSGYTYCKLTKPYSFANRMTFHYHRKPTQSEIKRGYGDIHHMELSAVECCKDNGAPKKWIVRDGLRYTLDSATVPSNYTELV